MTSETRKSSAPALQPSETAGAADATLDRVLHALFAPAGDRQRFWTYILVTVAVMVAAMLHVRAFGVAFYPLDDAYIVVHNVRVLHSGHDPNYPGVPAIAGSTSLVHLSLVWLVSNVVPDLGALYLVQWLSVLAYLLGVARLAFVCRASIMEAALLTLVGALAGFIPRQLLNGVETGLALAAITWLFVFLSEPVESRTRRFGAPLLCGLLPYVRPDLAALSLPALGMLALARLRSSSSRREALRGIAVDLAIAVAAALPWALWCRHDLGSVFPTTVAAKRCFFAESVLPAGIKFRTALSFVFDFLRFAGPVSLLLPLLLLRQQGRAGIVFLLLFVSAYGVEAPSTLSHSGYRYLLPLAPLLLLAAAGAFQVRNIALRGAVALVLAVTLVHVGRMGRTQWDWYVNACTLWSDCNRAISLWCAGSLPKDATVMVHDVGAMSYYTRLRLIDVVGLKMPASVESHRRFTLPSGGLRRGDAVEEIAWRGHPQYYVALSEFDDAFAIRDALFERGWSVTPIKTIWEYTVYQLGEPPGLATRSIPDERRRVRSAPRLAAGRLARDLSPVAAFHGRQ
jgi:hypothetical protein